MISGNCLAPDAHKDGTEVSRFAVPADPRLSFLGKPGDILWSAFSGS